MDTATQRKNMVESQVRPSDVTDRRVMRAMLEVPREAFLPADQRSLAYMDGPVRLKAASASPRTLLEPRAFAKLVQLAEIGDGDTVLDVGCASGYSAAILGKIAKSVVALECDTSLAEAAKAVLAGADHVRVITADLAQGAMEHGPYDAIVVEGAISGVPEVLLHQLKDGGRLVAILSDGAGKAVLWRRTGGAFGSVAAFDASADVLPGFEKVPAFAL